MVNDQDQGEACKSGHRMPPFSYVGLTGDRPVSRPLLLPVTMKEADERYNGDRQPLNPAATSDAGGADMVTPVLYVSKVRVMFVLARVFVAMRRYFNGKPSVSRIHPSKGFPSQSFAWACQALPSGRFSSPRYVKFEAPLKLP